MAKGKRFHWSKPAVSVAQCMNCRWNSKAANALGSAAQHHDLYGHVVECTVTRTTVYEKAAAYQDRQVRELNAKQRDAKAD